MISADQTAYLTRWMPNAAGFRGLKQATVRVGYCETCTETEWAVAGECLEGGKWRPFLVFAGYGWTDDGARFPGWHGLPDTDDDPVDGNAGVVYSDGPGAAPVQRTVGPS